MTFVFPDDRTVSRSYLEVLSVFRLFSTNICPWSLSEVSAKLSPKLFALVLLAFISESCQVTLKAEAPD